MTAFRRTAALLLVLLVTSVVGAGPATAGGPTSVLLSSPDKGRVAALYHSDSAYQRLMQLVESKGPDAKTLPADADSPHRSGTYVRATWLIHDMMVWRRDVIYVDAEGGPWIATTFTDGEDSRADTVLWHTSTRPGDLVAVLGSLGLLGAPKAPEVAIEAPVADPTTAPAPAPVQAPVTAAAEVGTMTGWRWSIPGFLAGGLLAVLAVHLLARRREQEPRWQLIDAE